MLGWARWPSPSRRGLFWLGPWRQNDRPAATAAEGIASIVALPSKVVAQASDQFLTDAIPNTISAHLTQVQGLETKMPPSSGEVERVQGDLGKLADVYGVSAFVLTSLTADADRLVLNVQLVEARSRRLLWSREFDGRRASYLALARGAAEELRGALRPQAAAVIPQSTTSSSDAELAYQRGMHHFNRYNNQHEKKDFDQGLAAFQQALALEPRMADAAAGIGWLYVFAIEAGTPLEQALPMIRQWGQLALEMDTRNSRVWALKSAAELLATPSRQHDALVAGLRGATYGPRDAFAVTSTGIALQGQSSSLYLASMQEAARLDPLYRYPPLNASELLVLLNRPEEALAYAEKVLRLEPEMPYALIRKGLALIELGRAAEVAALIPTLQRQLSEGRADPNFVAQVTHGAALIGDNAAAKRAALDRLEREAANLTNPLVNYPPSWPGSSGTAAPTARSRRSNAAWSTDKSRTTSCACRRTSRRSPATSGSSARSASRAPSSKTLSRARGGPRPIGTAGVHAAGIDRSAAHARHQSTAGQPALIRACRPPTAGRRAPGALAAARA